MRPPPTIKGQIPLHGLKSTIADPALHYSTYPTRHPPIYYHASQNHTLHHRSIYLHLHGYICLLIRSAYKPLHAHVQNNLHPHTLSSHIVLTYCPHILSQTQSPCPKKPNQPFSRHHATQSYFSRHRYHVRLNFRSSRRSSSSYGA